MLLLLSVAPILLCACVCVWARFWCSIHFGTKIRGDKQGDKQSQHHTAEFYQPLQCNLFKIIWYVRDGSHIFRRSILFCVHFDTTWNCIVFFSVLRCKIGIPRSVIDSIRISRLLNSFGAHQFIHLFNRIGFIRFALNLGLKDTFYATHAAFKCGCKSQRRWRWKEEQEGWKCNWIIAVVMGWLFGFFYSFSINVQQELKALCNCQVYRFWFECSMLMTMWELCSKSSRT